jgi:hypothetical protein
LTFKGIAPLVSTRQGCFYDVEENQAPAIVSRPEADA